MFSGNNFQVYLGIAVEDKQLQSRIGKFYIKELLPTMTGNLADLTGAEGYELEDALNGGKIHGNVKTTNCVVAEWFGFFTNRAFPPDIVRGEQALILRYADNDIYYWVSLGRDDNLRRGEIFRLAVSDDMSTVKDLDDDNTYFFEMDTKVTKRIRLKTSKSDGERFRYELVFDADQDFIKLQDDAGNVIEIHSKEPLIRLINNHGTKVELNQSNQVTYVPAYKTTEVGADDGKSVSGDYTRNVGGSVEQAAGGSANHQSGGDTDIEAGGNATLSAGGNATLSAGGNASVLAGAALVLSSAGGKITLSASGGAMVGDLIIDGNLVVTRNSQVGGNSQVGQDLTVGGSFPCNA